MMINCIVCGKEKFSKREHAKYCGTLCRNAAFRSNNRERLNTNQREWRKNRREGLG